MNSIRWVSVDQFLAELDLAEGQNQAISDEKQQNFSENQPETAQNQLETAQNVPILAENSSKSFKIDQKTLRFIEGLGEQVDEEDVMYAEYLRYKSLIPSEYADSYARLMDRLFEGETLSNMGNWLCENTTLNGDPFNFKHHEFQIDIANERGLEVTVKKCSQVGLTELCVRIMLALMMISNGKTGIYVLPSAKFASKFAKSRFDPVISASPIIKRAVRAANDSSEMKIIGNSILHIGGAASDTQAISVPANILFIDEYDFCRQSVITKYASRLRHNLDGGMRRRFSTPTVGGYGISQQFALSSQKYYLCKCSKCGEWQAPDFNTQVRIAGFDKTFSEFEKEDLQNPLFDVEGAYIECVKCGGRLDEDLANPALRAWVPKFPARSHVGYHVRPFDLILYNSTKRIIQQLAEYSTRQDFENFVMGEEFNSDENQVNVSTMRSCMVLPEAVPNGCYLGVDVGKTCHYFIGKKSGCNRYIFKTGTLRGDILKQLVELFRDYNIVRAVIDHGPDFTLGQNWREACGPEWISQCVYVRGSQKNPTYFDLDEETGMVAAARTKGFDVMVRELNLGRWKFPNDETNKDTLISHFKVLKRVEEINDNGERVARWTSTSDIDHYFHAGFYCMLAMDLDEASGENSEIVGSIPSVVGARFSGLNTASLGEIRSLLNLYGVK